MNWKRPLALSTAALTLGTALAACGNPCLLYTSDAADE